MAKIKRKKKRLTSAHDVILDASVKLFSVRGYTGTTMRDIAEKVGVLPGSLYAHIEGKEQILVNIVTSGIEEFLKIQSVVASSKGTPEEKLETAIKLHIAVVAKNPERNLIVFHQWRYLSEPNRSMAVKMRRRYAEMFTDLICASSRSRDRQNELDVKIKVFTILGALNWIPEWYRTDGEFSPEVLGDLIADTLINGLDLNSTAGTKAG